MFSKRALHSSDNAHGRPSLSLQSNLVSWRPPQDCRRRQHGCYCYNSANTEPLLSQQCLHDVHYVTNHCFSVGLGKIAFLSSLMADCRPKIFFIYNTTAKSFNMKKLYRRRLSISKSVLCAKAKKWCI